MLFMWQAAGVAPRKGGLFGAAGVRGVVAASPSPHLQCATACRAPLQ